MLCDLSDPIWRQGTPLEAMIGRTTFNDGILTDAFQDFPQLYGKCQEICAQLPVLSHYRPYHEVTYVTEVTLGASGLWLGTRTGDGGTAILA